MMQVLPNPGRWLGTTGLWCALSMLVWSPLQAANEEPLDSVSRDDAVLDEHSTTNPHNVQLLPEKLDENFVLPEDDEVFVPMIRKELRRELLRVRQCGEISPDARKKIWADCQPVVRQAYRLLVERNFRIHNAFNRGELGVREPRISIRSMIREALIQSCKRHLPPEATLSILSQIEKHVAFERESFVRSGVTIIDHRLRLSTSQRQELLAVLRDNWSSDFEEWSIYEVFWQNNPPKIPDDLVLPILNNSQKNVWTKLAKTDVGGSSSNNFIWTVDDQEWWTGEKLPPAKQAPNRLIE